MKKVLIMREIRNKMVTKELYKLTSKGITKSGHTMFPEDVVKDLNGWRNHARDFRNKNVLLLKEIGKLKAEIRPCEHKDFEIKYSQSKESPFCMQYKKCKDCDEFIEALGFSLGCNNASHKGEKKNG